MLGLSTLGLFHTAVSLVAIVAGFYAFARDKVVNPRNRTGQAYLAATVIVAATGLMMFRHGGFRIGHTFSVLTLVAVALGTLAAFTGLFGRAAPYVQATFYTSTMLIHMITGLAESLTRLPPEAPLVTAANAFIFKDIITGLVIAFLAGLALQFRWLRSHLKQTGYTGDIGR